MTIESEVVRQAGAFRHELSSRYGTIASQMIGLGTRGIFGRREAGNRRAKQLDMQMLPRRKLTAW